PITWVFFIVMDLFVFDGSLEVMNLFKFDAAFIH
ncbi:uncharacterized protein METZ01_LOCUS340007, partial [marine metagenome]